MEEEEEEKEEEEEEEEEEIRATTFSLELTFLSSFSLSPFYVVEYRMSQLKLTTQVSSVLNLTCIAWLARYSGCVVARHLITWQFCDLYCIKICVRITTISAAISKII